MAADCTTAGRPRSRAASAAVVCATAIACFGSSVAGPNDPLREQSVASVIAFTDVRVLTMEAERIDDARTVVVRDGRIATIGSNGQVAIPEGATIIAGGGRYLM